MRMGGAVFVISDISQLRRLEGHRRDFAMNVSHELRTPLTSIQGYAETLMNPAVQDEGEKQKFIDIIFRHSKRLNSLIEDLLALSRLERDSAQKQIELKKSTLSSILRSAVELCEVKSKEKGVAIRLDVDEAIQAKVNATLLEQAIVNLVDNAIKYSGSGKEVWVRAQANHGEVGIHVTDQGAGIPSEHLGRLFERFYRVDKARSRELGGTGLGLAIVKHVALSHGGRVDVSSRIGEGSQFSIYLPA